MGLMLSVLVFCVGVAEVLDCWHHFLLHLVQPQYNPIPYNLDLKTDILSEKELCPPPESRRPSHVDICWPKDLSPNDDLHVIKRRSHSESERNVEHDVEELDQNTVGKISHHEKYTDAPSCSRIESCHPEIVLHSPDTVDYPYQDSPVVSRDGSPNYLELSVIIESDSSSEMDEPSQIENLAYKKDKIAELAASPSKRDEESVEVTKELESIIDQGKETNHRYGGEGPVLRPSCPSSLLEENGSVNGTHIQSFSSSPTTVLEQASMPDLPVFTDNILSNDAKRVSCRYPADIEQSSNVAVEVEEVSDESDLHMSEYFTKTHPKNTIGEILTDTANNQPIEAILDEGLEPISEFPEIRLVESSPVQMPDSSDSSLNTSDASWMAKSKTSDRPLKVRFSPSPEDIAKEFMSVTKIDLTTLGSKDSESKESSVDSAGVHYHKDSGYGAQGLSEGTSLKTTDVSETRQTEDKFVKPEDGSNENDLPNKLYIDEQRICDIDSRVSSVNQVHPDTNSSSSSLSGIPQLPDDTKDTITETTLPSDNGYGDAHLETLVKTEEHSLSVFGDYVQSLSTQDSSNAERVESQFFLDNVIDTNIEKVDINEKLESNQQLPIEEAVSKNSHGDEAIKEDCNTPSKDLSVINPTDENSSDCKIKNRGCLETSLEGSQGTASSEKEPLSTKKGKTSKKRKTISSTKESLKDNSSESENIVVLCQAKESDEEDYVDNRVNSVSVKTNPPSSEVTNRDDKSSAKPGPSTSRAQEGAASTSKIENTEEKAFWLIFSGEYTKAMNKDWHSGHFCCWQCDESLTGQRYVLRDEHPYCIKCYESVFANGCEECNKTIGIDSKDLSYKDKHWHEACFLCNKCRVSLVDKQFGSKLDKIFCGNCYDAQFASRCDGCGQIFKAGTKKMEYKTRQWHEPCFACCVCKSAIGTKSFIPREQEIYCATCYEEKFATRCVKCNKIITSGGVTYKNEPWHRECFTCTNCSTSLAGQRFTSRDEKPYCADCFGELFAKRCTACCKPITGIGGTRFISFEDRHWHNDCFICASCKTSLVGRGFITDGDDIICPECAKQKLM